jgi:hypothetical protein
MVNITPFVRKSQLTATPSLLRLGVRVMVFNATLNNISVVSWQSVLLMEETRVPGENPLLAASN